jgi:hypothetical protein
VGGAAASDLCLTVSWFDAELSVRQTSPVAIAARTATRDLESERENLDMNQRRRYSSLLCVLLALLIACLLGCSKSQNEFVELQRYSIDSMEGLVTQSGAVIDQGVSSDGAGSLRITVAEPAAEPTVFRLFETGDIDIEDATLVYEARVRTEDVQGQVFLEMWCRFPDRGEFFSRGLMSALSGDSDWTTLKTPFFLKKGENPDNVKLNLVIVGTGTVWIDDVRVFKGPLG